MASKGGAEASSIYGEEIYKIAIGQGLYTSELPSNIPDGFSANAYNVVATGDSLENRVGLRPSSVDWHVSWAGEFHTAAFMFNQMTVDENVDAPVLMWGKSSGSPLAHTLCIIRSQGTSGSGDGFMEVAMDNWVAGAAQYTDRSYFTKGGTVYKIDSFNWVADSITFTSIPSSAIGSVYRGLFSFKDRLWAWADDKLYFTNIAATGGYPETWSSTNFVTARGIGGRGRIWKVVPLQNRLLIFTQVGLYTLTVQGEPGSWILRLLDSTSLSTSNSCAFESKGICYYVNTSGVWATNGLSVTKLSGVIEDQFFLAKGRRIQYIHPYEDGMILSIAKGNDTLSAYDAPNCKTFYSKLEPIAWTEWGIHPPEGETNLWGNNRILFVASVSQKIPTFLNQDPTVYVLVAISDSTEASPQEGRMQLLVFDGTENKGRNRVGDLITDPMKISFKTKYVDGGNAYSEKRMKEGLLEIFTSDTRHMFSYNWDIDSTSGVASTIPGNSAFTDVSVGNASNLIRLRGGLAGGGFPFRRCALNFVAQMQTNLSQIKIKDLALRLNTERNEFEQTR